MARDDRSELPDTRQATTTDFRSFGSDIAVRLVDRAGAGRASVTGELDLATAPLLGDFLSGFLARSTTCALGLDLGDVAFFDCAGLNVLLRLRGQAAARGVTLTISEASAVVLRVLDLTGTRTLFTLAPAHGPCQRIVRPVRTRP